MRLITQMLLAIALISQTAWADQTFGGGADMKNVMKIETVMASPADYLEAPITIKGNIVKVCRKRGCWMTLAAEKKYQSLTVKVPDGQMVFPLSAMGKTAYATGRLTAKPMDLEQTREHLAHQAKEAKQSFDADSVKEPMTMYRLTPMGVTIVD